MAKGDLVKTTTYLYEDEMRALREVADRERCSQAEVIRRAVRAYVFPGGGGGSPEGKSEGRK